MNHLPWAPDDPSIAISIFFSQIREDIRRSRCIIDINDTGDKLTTSAVDTGRKFIPGVNNTCGHVVFREIYIDPGDTGGKFATGVKDTLWSTHSDR